MSDTGDSTTRIGIDASVTGADSVAGLTTNVVALSQQLVNLSQSATRSFSIQDSLNKALDRTRLSTGLVSNSLAEYRKSQVLTNRVVEQATQQLNALTAAQAKVAASGKAMSPALSASYRQANSHLTSVVSSADALNRVLKTNAIEKFGQKLQASGQIAQRTSYYFAAATAPLLMSLRSAFFSYARLDQETRRLTKLIADEFGTGAEAISKASDKVRILGFELDKITAKYGTSRVLVQSLAGDFAELGVPDTAIVRLTEFTAAVEKLGNLDITQSQNFIQSIYQNILRVRRDMAAAEGYSLDLSSPKMMGQILSEVQGQLALFNMVENKTTLSLKDLADAFPEVSAAATTFGLSMTETAAMLAPMVAAGFQVGASANSIKVSLQRMVAMTKQNTQIIQGLNQALGDDFNYAAGVGMENIQQLVDGFNSLLSIKGEQGTLEFFARLFGVRQGPRMETSIRQLAVFQKALDNTSTAEGKIAAQLESSINARLTSHGYEAISVKKIVDLANVHRQATQEINGEYTIQARLVQQGQKDADAALKGAYTDTADYLSKVGTEAGKIFFTEAVGGVAAASIQMEQELGLAVDSVAVKFNKLKEAMLQIGRALAPIVDKVIGAILPVIQGIGDFLKKLSPFTQKIIGFLAFTLILIPQIRLLAATFKMAFGGIIGSLGKMMNAADGLGATLKGVRATSVSLAQILENPNITKGYNKLTQITDSQFLLQQDKNAPGYSNKLLGRRKMRPLDDSGLSQPVKELFANKGVVGPSDKTSIKTLLGKSTKLGLPNTDELIRSMLTDMGTIPEKIAESTAKATEKAATSTADKITKGLKNSVFQNNTFIGNKFGGGTAGPGGTGTGPRTPKTPATGGTPTKATPFFPTPDGKPIPKTPGFVTPRLPKPAPTGAAGPAIRSIFAGITAAISGMGGAPTAPIAYPAMDEAYIAKAKLIAEAQKVKKVKKAAPVAKSVAKARTIGAPIAATAERVAAEAQAQVEALGGIVQKEIAKADEVIRKSVKPKANATRGSPKQVKATVEKTVGAAVSGAIAPIEDAIESVTEASAGASEQVNNAVRSATKRTPSEMPSGPRVMTRNAKGELVVATKKQAAAILAEREDELEQQALRFAKEAADRQSILDEAARAEAEKIKEAAARGRGKKVGRGRTTKKMLKTVSAGVAVKPAQQAAEMVQQSVAAASNALEQTAQSINNIPQTVSKAVQSLGSGSGAGKIVSLSFKEMADVFQKAGVAIPKEWEFIRFLDRDFEVSQKQKKEFLKKLQEQIALSPQNPFGEWSENDIVSRKQFFPFRSAYEKTQKARPQDVLSTKHETKLPIFEGLFESQLQDQGKSFPGPEKQLRKDLLEKINEKKNKLFAGGVKAQAEGKAAVQAYQDMVAAKRAVEYAALDVVKGSLIPEGVENVLVSSSQEYITELEDQVKAGKSNLSKLEDSRAKLRGVRGAQAKRNRDVLDAAIKHQKVEIATLKDVLEYNSYNRFERIMPATKTDTAMLMAQTDDYLVSQSGIQNFPGMKEDYSRLFKYQLESIPVQSMDGKARALYELALTKEAKKIASSMDEATAQAIAKRMKSGKYGLTRTEAIRSLARQSLSMDVYNPMSQAYNPAAQADLINTKGLTADAKKAFLAAGGTEADGTALGNHFTEMRKELSKSAIAARAKSAADFSVVRAEYIAAQEAMRFPQPKAPVAPPRGAQSRGMFGMARGLMGPGGAYFANAGANVKAAVEGATRTYRELVTETIDNIINKLPASMGVIRKDLLKAVTTAVLKEQPLGAGQVSKKVSSLLDMSVIPETQGRVIKALAAVENQVVQDFSRAINEGWTYATSEVASTGKANAKGGKGIGKWLKSLDLFATNGDKLSMTLQGVIYDQMTAASLALNDIDDQISSGGFKKAKLREMLDGPEGLVSRLTRQRGGEKSLLKPAIRPVEQPTPEKPVEKIKSVKAEVENTTTIETDTEAIKQNTVSTETNTAATGENTAATATDTKKTEQRIAIEEAGAAADIENTATTKLDTGITEQSIVVEQADNAATAELTGAKQLLTAESLRSKALSKKLTTADELLSGAKFKQIGLIDSQISSLTAEQLASDAGTSLTKQRKEVSTKLNTLEKAKANLIKAENATLENALPRNNANLVKAKSNFESAVRNASKEFDKLKTVAASSAKEIEAAAGKAAKDLASTTAGTKKKTKPGSTAGSGTAGSGAASAAGRSAKVKLDDLTSKSGASGVIKAIEKQTLQFDSALANFFKGPNFFQGPNIFQGKIITADKLNLKIKDSAKAARDAAKALPPTDPLVIRAERRRALGKIRKKILDDGGVIDDTRAAKLRRITGIDPRRTVGSAPAAPVPRPMIGPILPKTPIFPTPTGAAIPKATALSTALDTLKIKASSVSKAVTGSIANGFNKGFSLAGAGLTKFAQFYVKTMLSTAASGSDASNVVLKSMTYLLSGGRKVVDEFALLGRASKALAAVNTASMAAIKTSAIETAFVMRALGTVVKSEVAPAFAQMVASLRNSKIIKAWTFLLFTGMNKVTGALRAASAAAGLFTSHATRMQAVNAALDAIAKKRVAAGLAGSMPMFQQLIVKTMVYTGLAKGLRSIFASLTKTMFAALTMAIKLKFAMLLIAPIFILIAGFIMSMKSGLVKNNAAVENFKSAWVAIREAIITLSKPLMEMIGKFGGLGKASNGANAVSGALHTLSRLVKYVADAFSRFAKGPGMRYMQEVIVPVLTRMINRFILLGRTIAGAFRGDASAIKNLKGLLLSLAYEVFNSLEKIFGFLANLLPKLAPVLSAMIEAVMNATIDAFMYIMNFGKEVALFFGSMLVGIGGVLSVLSFGAAAPVALIGAGLLAAAGAAHLLDKNIGRVKSGVKGISTTIGTGIAQGLGKGAGFIEENIFGKIKKAIARKYGEEMGSDVNAALASQLSDPTDVKKALNDTLGGAAKNAPGAKAAGESLGEAIAKGIKDKLISLKEDWTGNFFGKADDQVAKITENYKEAIDKQKEEALKAFDTQVSAIEALGKAEEELTAKMDYEEKRREMIRSRALDKENYLRERKIAKYEGRTEDVRSLDLSFRKSDQAAGKDISNLDIDRAKTLQEQQRSIAIAVINREKEAMAQTFDEMQKQFDINLEKILNKGFSTKEEFSALLSEIGGAAQGFSGELSGVFEGVMTSLPSIIKRSTDPSVGMFSMTMQKLVDQAKISFGAEVRTGDAKSILGSAYAMANGMPDAFKQAFSEGVISESVTPFIGKISAIMGGLNVDAIWIEAGRSAVEAMINEMKRKLSSLRGDLYNEFKNLFAGMGAEYNQLFPTLEKLAKEIARIEAIRSQSGGGGGDDSGSKGGGSGYDSLGKEVISVKYGEHLARKPIEDIGSAMDPKKFSFFGMLIDGAKNLAKALGPVKTAILGAVGAIAGFFVLKGVFIIIAKAFGILMTVGAKLVAPVAAVAGGITATGLAIAAAIGVVIGIIIYMYIKFKWFRDMVNDTFKSIMDYFVTGFQMLKDPVVNFLSGVWDAVKQIFDSLFGPIIDFGKKIVMGIVGAIAGVIIVIVGALRGMSIALDFIKVPLFKVVGWIINLATGIVGVLADIISGTIDFIYKIIGALFTVGIGGPIKLVIGAFKLAFDIIVGIVKIAIDLITKAFDFLKGALSGPFEVGFGIIKDIFNKIKGIVSGVIDFIKGIFGGLDLNDVVEPVTAPFRIAFGFVTDIFGKILSTIKGTLEAVAGVVISVFNTITTNPVFIWIRDFLFRVLMLGIFIVAMALQTLFFTWKGIFTKLIDIMKPVGSFIWDVLSAAFGALQTVISVVADAIGAAFGFIKDIVVGVFGFIYETIKGFINWWNENIGSLWLIFVAVFALMYEGARMLFNWMKDTFGPILAKVWDAFKAATSAVWDLMKQVGSWIGTAFSVVWDILKKAASLYWDYLNFAIELAWGAMKTVASWIGTAFGLVWGVLKKAASLYWDYLNFIIPFLWDVMKKVVSWIGTAFSKAWDVISVVATKAFEILGGAINLVWEIIKNGWSIVRVIFEKIIDVLQNPLAAAWGFIKGAIELVWGVITDMVDAVLPLLKTIGDVVGVVLKGAWDILSKSISIVWDIIKFGWDKTKPVFDGLWGIIWRVIGPAVKLLGQLFGFLWDGIKAAWSFVEPIFSAMVEIISNILSPVVEFLGSLFQKVWDGIMAGWEFIKPVFDWIADIVGNVIKTYVEALQFVFGLLWDGIKAGWDLIGPIFGLMVDVIKNGIKGAIDIVMFLWDHFWNGIKISWSFLKPIFDFIVDAIKKGIGFAIDLIKRGWDLFVGALTSTKDFIIGIIQAIGGFIRDGIQFAIEKVISVWNGLKDAFSAVWTFIQPIISKIGDMIKNVIGGAIDFIKDGLSKLGDAFKGSLNLVIGLINKMTGFSFTMPGWLKYVPGMGAIAGKTYSFRDVIPAIPTLYNGGKVGMYMKGGMAYGAGGMTDGPAQQGIPAVLHGGEYVINHKAVQRIGTDTLDRLNSLRLSKPNFPTMPSVPSIKMPNAGMSGSSYGQPSSSSTQNVNIYVDNFIGEPEWFNSMMKSYNTTVLPRNQKSAGLESRVINTYNGLNRGL
jgi:phage-related protein